MHTLTFRLDNDAAKTITVRMSSRQLIALMTAFSVKTEKEIETVLEADLLENLFEYYEFALENTPEEAFKACKLHYEQYYDSILEDLIEDRYAFGWGPSMLCAYTKEQTTRLRSEIVSHQHSLNEINKFMQQNMNAD